MDSSVVSATNWAELPKDLLGNVLEKLYSLSDCVRFSKVCVTWYRAILENHKLLVQKLERQVPLLLLPKKGDEKGFIKNLYNVTTKKILDLKIQVPLSTRYGGSSRGWLIAMGEDFIVTLINPISPGAVIRLPPILRNQIHYNIQIRKAILSADPAREPNDYTVAVIYGDRGQLAVIKPGREEPRWTYIDKIKTVFNDIIYYEGRLHASDYSCKAFSFDDIDIKLSSVPREFLPTPYYLDGESYLVESLEGDLLMVYRCFEFFFDDVLPNYRKTERFEVYKWNPSRQNWIKVENLGNECLFLGDNMSTSVLASEFSGCSPNSIYFTHDFNNILPFGDRGPIDCGVYDLKNSSFIPHYEVDEASRLAMGEQPPIWFVPNCFPSSTYFSRLSTGLIEDLRLKFAEILV